MIEAKRLGGRTLPGRLLANQRRMSESPLATVCCDRPKKVDQLRITALVSLS